MKKYLIYIIPSLFILLSVLIMTSGNLLKQPMGEDDHLYRSIQRIEKLVLNKEWKEAKEEFVYAQNAWPKIMHRIQFSVDQYHLTEINATLSKMKGSLESQDEQMSFIHIYYFYDLWEHLGR